MPVSRRLAISVVIAATSAVALALVFIQDFAPRCAPAREDQSAPDLTKDRTGPAPARDAVAKLNRRANELAARGNNTEALALLARAIEIDPGCAPAHYNRGRIHHRRGDYAASLREYEKALELRPDYAKALTNRAILLARSGGAAGAAGTEQALADLTRAIELSPGRTPAYYHRARLRLTLGRHESARADLDRLLEIDPLDRKARLLRSEAKRALGDATGAEEDRLRARGVEKAGTE